jgi:transposase
MRITITLHHKTRQALRQQIILAQETKNIKWYQRLMTICFLGDKVYSLAEIAHFFQLSKNTVREWVKLFFHKGLDGLRYKRPTGRPTRMSSAQKKTLKTLILKGPEAMGYQTGVWNCALVQEMIEDYFSVIYSPGYVSQLLRNMGMSHTKVQAISHKADKTAQNEWLEKTLPGLFEKAINEKALIFYQDESTAQMWSKPAHSWGERGKKIEAKVHLGSTRQKIYGAIELNSGELIWMFSDKSNHREFLKYLKRLIQRHPGKKLYVIIDNGPIHQGPALRHYLEKNTHRIELVRLPKYSPQFNPIERLWKQFKKLFLHNRYFADKKAFLKELRKGLRFFQNNPALVMSLMEKWFWMYRRIRSEMNSNFYEKRMPLRLVS